MATNHTKESKEQLDPELEVPDPDTICGIGGFQPHWMQRMATARTFLVMYSILGTLSGTYYTYRIGIMSTLEKRFAFNSKISGFIMMVDEVTPIFFGVPVGHWAARTHRPRMIALGMLLMTLCCFLSSVPYFVYGPETRLGFTGGQKNETGQEVCSPGNQDHDCEIDDRPPTVPVVLLLLLSGLLKGFGNIAYHAVGLAYMDDIVKKKNSPLYLATTFSLRLLGPILGYLMSSACLSYYENPLDDPGYGPEDPRWIGGWWMGFLIQGILLFIFSVLISLFPRRMPGQKQDDEAAELGLSFNFTEMLKALKRLGTNPVFMIITFRTVMEVGYVGLYMNLPKYMEHQFRLTASDASLYSGPPGLAAVMSSMVAGGYLIYRYRPSARVLTAWMFVLEFLAAVGPIFLIFPSCQNVPMTHYGLTDKGYILEAECNLNCNCSTSDFTPVCGSDRRTVYFSPCHAGCTQADNQTFSNCSCLWETDGMETDTVVKGMCPAEDCWPQALIYIIILPILHFLTSLCSVAYTMILFRAILPSDKSIAIGFLETFLCLLGYIPFLAVFGAMVDSVCLVWEESCGESGNCWVYDIPRFNYLLHGTSAGFSALSALSLLFLFFLSNRIGDLYSEDPSPKGTENGETGKATLSMKEL